MKVFFDGLGCRELPQHYDLTIMINLHWAEGLEGEHPQPFNLVECPETGRSTQWDFDIKHEQGPLFHKARSMEG